MEAFTYVLKSMAILSIFYTIYFIFFREETLFTAKRYFFLAGIVASIILPFVEVTKPIYLEQASFLSLDQFLPFQNTMQATPIEIEAPFDWWLVAYAVYGIGIIVFFLRFVVQLLTLQKELNKYPASKQGKNLFIETKEKVSPFSFFNYIVFNPEQHKQEELAMILQHEKVHVSQWHSIDIIAANLLLAIHWINPLAWLYKKSLEENLEFIADHETVARVASKKQYQLALVKNLLPFSAPTLTTQFYQSVIKKRILMLNKSSSRKRNVWKLSMVLPFLCIFLWSFSVKEEVHYIKPESSIGKLAGFFTILPATTDQELDLIEAYLEEDHAQAKIKISNRKRDENGLINAFEFKTKFKDQDRFYKRFSVNGDSRFPYKGHTIQFIEGIINISEIGPKATKFKITKDVLQFIDFGHPTSGGKKDE